MSTGVEGSESEMHEEGERGREIGRESATMRESRDRDAVMQKTWTKRGASESIAFRNERKRERGSA